MSSGPLFSIEEIRRKTRAALNLDYDEKREAKARLKAARSLTADSITALKRRYDIVSPGVPTTRSRKSPTTRATPVEKGMHSALKLLRLSVSEIDFYENNPRTQVNEKFDEIKESIRSRGIDHPVKVTKRPGTTRYVLAAGGNTRLRAIKELLEETGDARYAQVDCLWSEYSSELDIDIAHAIENEHRGALCFWDSANQFVSILDKIAQTRGHKLSYQDEMSELAARGLPVGRTALWTHRFASERLRTLGDAAALMGYADAKHIQKTVIQIESLGKIFGSNSEALRDSVFEPALIDAAMAFDQSRSFDREYVINKMHTYAASFLSIDSAQLQNAFSIVQNHDGLTWPSLLALLSGVRDAPERARRKSTTDNCSFDGAVATTDGDDKSLPNANKVDRGLREEFSATSFAIASSSASLENVMRDVTAEHLHELIRTLLLHLWGNDSFFQATEALPFGFFVDLPNVPAPSKEAATVWWWLMDSSRQGTDEGMQILPESQFGSLCRERDDWKDICIEELAIEPRELELGAALADPDNETGTSLLHTVMTMREFRRNAPHRFTADFWN